MSRISQKIEFSHSVLKCNVRQLLYRSRIAFWLKNRKLISEFALYNHSNLFAITSIGQLTALEKLSELSSLPLHMQIILASSMLIYTACFVHLWIRALRLLSLNCLLNGETYHEADKEAYAITVEDMKKAQTAVEIGELFYQAVCRWPLWEAQLFWAHRQAKRELAHSKK